MIVIQKPTWGEADAAHGITCTFLFFVLQDHSQPASPYSMHCLFELMLLLQPKYWIILLRNLGCRQKPSQIRKICGNPPKLLTSNPLTAVTPGERSFKHALRWDVSVKLRNEVYVEHPALICSDCGPARSASFSVIGAGQPSCADISAVLDGSGIHNTQL
jgi:hypothetical protein